MLTRQGLRMDRRDPDAARVRRALTVTPTANDAFGTAPAPFPTFLESEKYLYMPRHATCVTPVDKWEAVEDSCTQHAWENGGIQLREAQVPVAQRLVEAMEEKCGALLTLPCGFGKTVLSVWLMSRLKVRTLVVVHKEFLMSQFAETIARYFPDIRIGRIQGKTCDVSGKHVVLGMLQTLSRDDTNIPQSIRTMFDLVVCDECHHIAARVFSRAMLRFPSRYTLGLSATPERKDGLSRVIEWFVGSTRVAAEVQRPPCSVRRVQFAHRQCGCAYGTERRQNYGKFAPLLPAMINDLTECPRRLEFLRDIVYESMTVPGRNVLVVGDRVQHLRDLQNLLADRPDLKVGLYIGGMKQRERDAVASECNVILGTYAMTREGLDIKKLNTLIVATPTGDVIQTVGRILRAPGDPPPYIVDILDGYSVFYSQARKRLSYYKSQNYDIISNEHVDQEPQQQEELDGYAFCD